MKALTPKAERRFYTGMSIAILIIVFLGFSQSFYLRPLFPDNPAPSYPMVYVHGAIFSLWVILFMVQVSLIRKNRINWHRKVGLFTGLLAIIIVVQGLDLAFSAVRAGRVDVRFGGSLPLILPVTDIVLFSSFVLLGLINRLKPQHHKRWMLLATINLINAAIGRLPGASALGPVIPLLIFTLFVVALAVWDFKSTGKLHRVTLIGGLLTILSQPLRFIFAETAIWQVFEKWVIGIGG
jgi:uncharacterized membrane protein YozB (DUF420 family)